MLEKAKKGMEVKKELPVLRLLHPNEKPLGYTGIIQYYYSATNFEKDNVDEIVWYKNGEIHNENGFAVIADMGNFLAYYLHSVEYSYEDYYSHPRIVINLLESILEL